MFDVDRVAADGPASSSAMLARTAGALFAPAHLPEPAFGRLVTADGLRAFRWA